MKYRRNLSITLTLCTLALVTSQSAILAQDSIEVRTHECYWVDPWWIGADTVRAHEHIFWKRYNPILKIWVMNNQNKEDTVSSLTVQSECDDLLDVQEVLVYREAHNLPNPQPEPWDTCFFYYASRRDSLCAWGSFDSLGRVFLDFAETFPNDSIRFQIAADDSILFYVIFLISDDLPSGHTGNLLDAMIPQNGVQTHNGFTAPAANQGDGRTYRLLLDATPPNLTEENIHIDVWGDSAAVKLGVVFTDSMVNVTDNVTGAIPQSVDDILVFTDMRTFGTGFSDKRLTRIVAADDFAFTDSIRHEDRQGYGVDIEAYERLSGVGTPGSYIQKMTAWDEFGNSDSVWDLENPKPIDTIWPDSNLVEWFLHYDANSDGVAALGDSIKIRIDMRFQPPAGEPDEIMNKDVFHPLFPRNGVYFADRYDFRGFDPPGVHYTYPFEFSNLIGNEIWNLIFEAKQGYWDVDSGDADAYVYVTAEDNANYWPGSAYPSIDHIGPGNLRRWKSDTFPFGVDTKLPYPVYELSAQASADNRIHLSWRDSTDDNDKGHYYIYWNNGTGGIGGIDTISYCAFVSAPESSWTSEPLNPSFSYCFLIRNMDDAGNMEKNFGNIICQSPNDLAAKDTLYSVAGFPCSSDGDTLYFRSGGGEVTIYINIWNDADIIGIAVPLTDTAYGPPSNAYLDSANNNGATEPLCFQGSRAQDLGATVCWLDSNPPQVFYGAQVVIADPMPPGDGLFATMVYTVSDTGRICLDTLVYLPTYVLAFVDTNMASYTPHFTTKCFSLRPYLCGDGNGDGSVGLPDIVYLINYVLKSGSTPAYPSDVNCDSNVDITDVVYLINYLFQGGHPPCDPDGNGVPDC